MMTNEPLPRKSILELIRSCSGTLQDQRNSRRFTFWCLAWALAYVGASWALKADMDLAPALVWSLVFVPILLMIGAVFSYMHFLRNADELLQKIQFQGLAMGFAAAVVFVTGYQLVEAAGANEMQTDHLMLVMIFSWVGGQLYGSWRYR
ncbi:MAG: hypothetical protein GXP15_04315 [Gammaproteobacteria bacterium]|nr:hypothetical protein [Gammaproteobacteria bacterium]